MTPKKNAMSKIVTAKELLNSACNDLDQNSGLDSFNAICIINETAKLLQVVHFMLDISSMKRFEKDRELEVSR